MEIKKLTNTSCNFCDRGKLSASGNSLRYPYKEVYYLGGTGIGATICIDCLSALGEFLLREVGDE